MKFVKTIMALLMLTSSAAMAQVNLQGYGFSSNVAADAQCVHNRIPSHSSNDVAHRYWSATTKIDGQCKLPRTVLGAADNLKAKTVFLTAYRECKGGQRVTDDTDLYVLQVADAVSVLSASGVRDSLTGVSLLDRLNKGSHQCSGR